MKEVKEYKEHEIWLRILYQWLILNDLELQTEMSISDRQVVCGHQTPRSTSFEETGRHSSALADFQS